MYELSFFAKKTKPFLYSSFLAQRPKGIRLVTFLLNNSIGC